MKTVFGYKPVRCVDDGKVLFIVVLSVLLASVNKLGTLMDWAKKKKKKRRLYNQLFPHRIKPGGPPPPFSHWLI